jgi:hypothetical protein
MEHRAAARYGLQIKSGRGFFRLHSGELLVRAIGSVDGCSCDIEAKLAQAAYLLQEKRMGDAGITAEKIAKAVAVSGWLAFSSIHVLVTFVLDCNKLMSFGEMAHCLSPTFGG